jgi:hypothetical protein
MDRGRLITINKYVDIEGESYPELSRTPQISWINDAKASKYPEYSGGSPSRVIGRVIPPLTVLNFSNSPVSLELPVRLFTLSNFDPALYTFSFNGFYPSSDPT